MNKTRTELVDELEKWGAKMERTQNRLSKREIEGFYAAQKAAEGLKMSDRDIDQAIRLGRRGEQPRARYDEPMEVTKWI